MIIGLTGRNASGKGEVASFLRLKGLSYFSLSDVLREELSRSDAEVTRDNLVEAGRRLRAEEGEGVLASRILALLEIGHHDVVDSFRHPAEVEVFRHRSDFTLVLVEASAGTRFERIRERNREGDPNSLEEFQRLEEAEATSQGAGGQELEATARLADHSISNEGDLDQLHGRVGQLLQRLMAAVERPDWDHYFMHIAQVAALRSNCIKRKVAAIIVRDRRVVSTGYNGTPRGTTNCFEGGCPRCNNLADSGTKLDECLCSHGEENAIVQAAFHGVSVKDSTLYTTFAPCLMCTKMIINAGIREVVFNRDYPLNEGSFRLLNQAQVECRQLQVE